MPVLLLVLLSLYPGRPINPRDSELGMVGYFGTAEVVACVAVGEVIDGHKFVGRVMYGPRQSAPYVFRVPTKGLADSKLIDDGSAGYLWRIVGTEKHGGRTLYAVEPWPLCGKPFKP